MRQTADVFNKSKLQVEQGKRACCPRCKGAGGTMQDWKRASECYFCKGKGELWLSESGWGRAIGAPLMESDLY